MLAGRKLKLSFCHAVVAVQKSVYSCFCTFISRQALYLDGVRMFGEKLEELVDVLSDREIHVRLPLEELELIMESSKSSS